MLAEPPIRVAPLFLFEGSNGAKEELERYRVGV